jgi:hypothetical protein
LFHNVKGKLELVRATEGTGLAQVAVSRGLAVGDLFNDGKMDTYANNLDGEPSLFQNVMKSAIHFIAFKLVGGPNPPRDTVESSVYVTANGFTQRSDVMASGSFASSLDQRPRFGLGIATRVDKIEIRSPDGVLQQVAPPAEVNGFYRILEGGSPERIKL